MKSSYKNIETILFLKFSVYFQVERWINSVPANPVPLTYEYMPLNVFLETSLSNRKDGLVHMETFERDRNFLKKIYFEMSTMTYLNRLGKFMQESVRSEL